MSAFAECRSGGNLCAGIGLLPDYTPIAEFFERNGLTRYRAKYMVAGAKHPETIGHIMQAGDSFGVRHQHRRIMAQSGRTGNDSFSRRTNCPDLGRVLQALEQQVGAMARRH
jgi:hypothetical protein